MKDPSPTAYWVGEGESPRILVRRDRFEPKRMFYVFSKTAGVIYLGDVEMVAQLLVNTV